MRVCCAFLSFIAEANFNLLSTQKFNADNQVKKYLEDVRLLETQMNQGDVLKFDMIINDVARRDDTMVAESIQAARDRGDRVAAAEVASSYLRVPVSPAAVPQPEDGSPDNIRLPDYTNPMHLHPTPTPKASAPASIRQE